MARASRHQAAQDRHADYRPSDRLHLALSDATARKRRPTRTGRLYEGSAWPDLTRAAVFPVVTTAPRVVVVIPPGALVIVLTAIDVGGAAAAALATALHGPDGAAQRRADRRAGGGAAAADIVADDRARQGAQGRAARGV